MRHVLTGAGVGALILAPAVVFGSGEYVAPAFAAAVIVGLFAGLSSYRSALFDEPSPSAWRKDVPAALASEQTMVQMDLDEELADLIVSASQRAIRILEDGKRLTPFVMFEDASGDVRTRLIDAPQDRWLSRARETARGIDSSAPRVVIAVDGQVTDGARWSRAAVLYEAAERTHRPRTLAFIQLYRPRRLIFSGQALTNLVYFGDAAHVLRFTDDAET